MERVFHIWNFLGFLIGSLLKPVNRAIIFASMADEPDLPTIAENGRAPKTVDIDGMRTTQHSIPDQILAENHEAAKKVSRNPLRLIRTFRIKPPSARG